MTSATNERKPGCTCTITRHERQENRACPVHFPAGGRRRALLAKVHVARKGLGLDDDTYRAVLERVTKHRSAGELDDAGLERALGEFRRLGWVPEAKGGKRPSERPHIRKVWAIWASICRHGGARNPTRQALRALVERLTGVTDPEWLTVEQARTVIESLKTWERRAKRAARGSVYETPIGDALARLYRGEP